MKPTLILIGADKGGVGKTTIARAMIDYFNSYKKRVLTFDTEVSNGVLKRFDTNAGLVDIGTVAGQMHIFDLLIDDTVVLVDLRAGQLSHTLKFLSTAGYVDDAGHGKLRLVVCHVVDASVASASEVPQIISNIEGAEYIMVRNHRNPDADFDHMKPSVATTTIDIPYLAELAAEAVDRSDQRFAAFADNVKPGSEVLSRYVRVWLRHVFLCFDQVSIMGAK